MVKRVLTEAALYNNGRNIGREGDDSPNSLPRPMPHSAEAERAILGAIILDNSLAQQVIDLGLMPHDFYIRANQLVWMGIVELVGRGSEINPILLGEWLRAEGLLDQTGGVPYISELTYGLPHFTSLAAYAKVVRSKSALRQIIKIARKIIAEAHEEEDDAEVILSNAETMVLVCVSENTRKHRMARPREYVRVEEDIPRLREVLMDAHTGKARNLSTGLAEFDRKLEGGGLRPQGFYIVAAKPKAGKTAFVLGIGRRVAQFFQRNRVEGSVGIISMEMERMALEMRMLSAHAKVPFTDMTRAGFRGPDFEVAMASVEPMLRGLPLYVTDAVYAVDEMWRVNERLVYGPAQAKLIIVDYLQLAEVRKAHRRSIDDRYEVVSFVSREIKHMAQEFDVPIIGVSSITRSAPREGRRAELHDLRESGYLEYDAEAVTFLENPDWKPKMSDDEYEALNARPVWDVNANLAAQRNGETGLVPFKLLRKFMDFMSPEEYEKYMRQGRPPEPDFNDVPSL